MSSKVTIVGADGQPFKPARAQMLAGGGMTPYDAADMVGAQMAAWRPYLASPDNELNLYRDRIVRRGHADSRQCDWREFQADCEARLPGACGIFRQSGVQCRLGGCVQAGGRCALALVGG